MKAIIALDERDPNSPDGPHPGNGDPDRDWPDGIRIEPSKKPQPPSGTEIAFDPRYIPLSAVQRRIRRELIRPWVVGPDRVMIVADPYVAAILRRQEEQEIAYLEALRATYGKAADWRIAVCLEAKRDVQVRNELAWWLSNAVIEGDANELKQFQQVVKTIKRIEETAPVNRAKALAILFILRFKIENGFLPTRPIVKAALVKMNCKVRWSANGVTDKRFWTGPILSMIPHGGKGGRPRKG